MPLSLTLPIIKSVTATVKINMPIFCEMVKPSKRGGLSALKISIQKRITGYKIQNNIVISPSLLRYLKKAFNIKNIARLPNDEYNWVG